MPAPLLFVPGLPSSHLRDTVENRRFYLTRGFRNPLLEGPNNLNAFEPVRAGEPIRSAIKIRLDMEKVIGVISKGAAQSWQMDNRAPTMIEGKFEFGFPVMWMHKDLKIILEEGNRNGALLPTTALIDQYYHQVIEAGGARWDTSSLLHNLT